MNKKRTYLEDPDRPMTLAEMEQQNEDMGWTPADLALMDKFDKDPNSLTKKEMQAMYELEDRNWEQIAFKKAE